MHTSTRTRRSARHPREAGLALAASLFVLAMLLLITASSVMIGSTNVLATRNFRGAARAHFVAESAIMDALQTFNGPGVINFQNDVVGLWPTSYGAGSRAFAPLPGFTYTVTATATPGNPAGAGRFIATANGPERERNVVVANISRSALPLTAPGAVYLATDQHTDATFTGNAFLIDGNDHNYTGGTGPGAPVPGIATRNDTNTQEALGSLKNQQPNDVLGLGFLHGPPTVASIGTYPAAPTIAQMNQFIDDLLARAGVVNDSSTKINGNQAYGTTDAPQITHLTASGGVTIKANGNVSGAGILIVESDLTIQGNLDFKGLVLVRGHTNVQNDPSQTEVTGNGTIWGSLWTQDFNFVVGGSAEVLYSSQAMQLANQVGGGGALPEALVVNSLADCAELPAGTGGCP